MKNVCPKNPCPFCGAHLENDPPSSIWYHPSNGCLLSLRAISGEQQIEKWDKRYGYIPTTDPETLRPTAHWITDSGGSTNVACSACNAISFAAYNFCPHCGKRMVNADD